MQHKQKQEDAFVEIHHAMYGELYRFVRHCFGNEDDVDAEVDRIFLGVARELAEYQGECRYRVWAFSVAYATLRAPWWRGRRVPSPAVLPQEPANDEPEQHQIRIEAIQHRFRQLGVEEQAVILLQSAYEFSVAELALILGLSEGKARTLAEQTAGWLDELPAEVRTAWPDVLDRWRQQPSDFDLIDQKAGSLARVMRRLKRAKVRRRWLPVAGAVAIAALALAVVYLPSEFKEAEQPVTAPKQQVPALIELSEIPAGLSEHEASLQRDADYRNQGYQRIYATEGLELIFDPQGLYAVKITPGQAQVEKKLLLTLQGNQIPHIRGSNDQYLLLSDSVNNGHEINESLLLLDLTSLTLTPVPTGQGQIRDAVIWQDDSVKVVYSLLDGSRGEGRMSIITYDIQTGEEQTVHEMSEGGANYFFVEGSILVINANHELYVVDRAGKRLVVRADGLELTAFSLRNGTHLLYGEGLPGMMIRPGVYTGKTKVMMYDLATRQKRPLLGDREGDQYVIFLPHFQGEMLIGNFVPEPGAQLTEPSSDLQGVTELWHVDMQWEVKRIYRRGTLWSHHWLDYRGSMDGQGRQIALQAFTDNWALLVDVEQRTAREYSSVEIDQMLQRKK